MRQSVMLFALVLCASLIVVATDQAPAGAGATSATVGFVDPRTGEWHLRGPDGWVTTFYFGDPGDVPMVGDWDCDGVDTPGLYRQSDGFVYLRNSNTQGIADIRFFFGNPGDVPLAGDFNGNGCDTVSIYRPTEGRVFIINELGDDDDGLGAAELDYYFGNPGDQPFVGDFDGDGIDTIGLHRVSTGFVYYRNSHTQGVADDEFFFGDPGDRFVAGDWNADGIDSPGVFRPSDRAFYARYTNSQGNADDTAHLGGPSWLPVAGHFGLMERNLDERGWSSYAVDDLGDPGRFNDIATGLDGLPLISYGFPLGTSYDELRVAHCTDRACSGADVAHVYGAMFESTSVAVSPTGPPIIAFHRPGTQRGLVIAHCQDAACSTADIEPILESSVNVTVKYVDAAFTSAGSVVMSVDSGPSAKVIIGTTGAWDEQGLGFQLIEHSRPALSVGRDDLSNIVFPAQPTGSGIETELTFPTRLASCADTACTYGLIEFRTIHELVVETGNEGLAALGDAHDAVTELADGNPAVAIAWTAGPGLDLVSCRDPVCEAASTTRIDPTPGTGRFVDLETTADGDPIMAYAAPDGDVRVAWCHDPTCSTFEVTTLASPGLSGTEVSLTLDWTGTPVVAYWDKADGALVVARLR